MGKLKDLIIRAEEVMGTLRRIDTGSCLKAAETSDIVNELLSRFSTMRDINFISADCLNSLADYAEAEMINRMAGTFYYDERMD